MYNVMEPFINSTPMICIFNVTLEVIDDNEDLEANSTKECRQNW